MVIIVQPKIDHKTWFKKVAQIPLNSVSPIITHIRETSSGAIRTHQSMHWKLHTSVNNRVKEKYVTPFGSISLHWNLQMTLSWREEPQRVKCVFIINYNDGKTHQHQVVVGCLRIMTSLQKRNNFMKLKKFNNNSIIALFSTCNATEIMHFEVFEWMLGGSN